MDFSLVGGVFVGVVFAVGTVATLFHGALSGIRSYMLALALLFLSAVPFLMTYRRCQTSARATSETFTDCLAFTPIYPLAGLGIGILTICCKFVRDDVRTSEQESAHRWRPAAAVVEEGWRQEGHLLKGVYRAHSFEAFAMDRIARNQYDPGTYEYRVSVFVKPGGFRWSLRHGTGWMVWNEAAWRLRSWNRGLAGRLERAGAVELVRGAQRSIDLASRPRITYVPQFGELRFRDESGRAPYPDIFRDHLEILVALAALNQDENV